MTAPLYSELSKEERSLFSLNSRFTKKGSFKRNDDTDIIPLLCVINVGGTTLNENRKVVTRDFMAKIDIPFSTYNTKILFIETEERITIDETKEVWRISSVESIDEFTVTLNCYRHNLKAVKAV